MKLLQIIPIAKEFFFDDLAYFTAKDVKPGALVLIQIKNRTLTAIVRIVKDAKNEKYAIRRSDFSLRKIKEIKNPLFINPDLLKIFDRGAAYFAAPTGAVIKNLVSSKIVELGLSLYSKTKQPANDSQKPSLIEGPKEERIKYYKGLIREEFAKNCSVFLCFPTAIEMQKFIPAIQKGIEKYIVVLHGKITKKELVKSWDKISDEKHPLLIIGSPLFMLAPRKYLKTIIMEKESSRHYKVKNRPYLDYREVAEIISEALGAHLIFGDNVSRIETFYRKESGSISSLFNYPNRSLPGVSQSIIDMRENKATIIGDELKRIIQKSQTENKRVILFINRRGFSATTLCKDCGFIVICPKCDTPMVVHQFHSEHNEIGRRFLCHKCFTTANIINRCPHCNSWNMQDFGLGIQKVAENIGNLFPDARIFKLDGDTVKTRKQGENIAKEWLETPAGILVATEIIFSFLDQPADYVAVVSIDNLFTIPDFRVNERIFRLILRLKNLAKEKFVIQTHVPENNLFKNLTKENVYEFYQSELEIRKKFNYPPYKRLIKITIERKSRDQMENDSKNLIARLKDFNPFSFPAFISKIKNQYSWRVLLKIDPEMWRIAETPKKEDNEGLAMAKKENELRNILFSLPPSFKIDVDPETLL